MFNRVTLLRFERILTVSTQETPFQNNSFTKFLQEPLSGIALGYGLDDRGFESQQGLGIFLFTTASRLALEPTQSPIWWILGALFLV
jgi:hypothetical protein